MMRKPLQRMSSWIIAGYRARSVGALPAAPNHPIGLGNLQRYRSRAII